MCYQISAWGFFNTFILEVLMYLSDVAVEDFGLVHDNLYLTVDGHRMYKIIYATIDGYEVEEVLYEST